MYGNSLFCLTRKRFFKALTLITVFVIATISGSAWAARTFYVDPVNGSNGNDGLSETTAWKNFERINPPSAYSADFAYIFEPGDRILLKRGATWDGQSIIITTPQMGIGAYGDENAPKPRIRGAASLGQEPWVGSDLDFFIDDGAQADRFYGWGASASGDNWIKADTDTHDGKGYSARLESRGPSTPQLFRHSGTVHIAASGKAKFRFWAKVTSGQLNVAISNGNFYYDNSTGTWETGFRTAWSYTTADAPDWTLIETPVFTTHTALAQVGITFRVTKNINSVGESRVDDVVLAGVWEPHVGNVYKRILLPATAGSVYAAYSGDQAASLREKIRVEDLVSDGDWFWEGGKTTLVYCRSVHPGTDYDFYRRNPNAECETGYEPYDGPIPDNRVMYMYWSGGLESLNQQDLYAARGDQRNITLNADGNSADGIAMERGSMGILVRGSDTTVSNSRVRYTENCAMLFSKSGAGYITNALVSGNEVDDIGCGIYLYQVRDSRVAGNRINWVHNRGTKADHESTGAQFGNYNIYEYNHVSDTWGGIDFYGTETYHTTNNIIRYNLVEYAHYQGMVFFGHDSNFVGYTYDNVVHNNVVRYSGESNAYCGKDCVFGGGAPGAGIRVRNTPVTGRNYFYNNILYANSHNFSGTRCASGAFTFMNNLSLNPTVRHLDFAGNDTPACSQYNDFASATADYNLYWPATGTGLFDWHGVYDSFESYASNTGQDAHGLAADPLLTNPVGGDFHWAGTPSIIPGAGDYRLMANSPAIDAGTNVGLTPDIAGNPIGGAPEIGAYEILAPDLVPTMLSVTKSGNKIYVSDTVLNQGNTAAGSFTVAYYLSTDSVFDSATDIALASSPNGSGTCTRAILALDAGTTSSVTNLTCYRPSAMIEGVHYYVLGVIDSANQVVESNETNNVRATSGTIQR